MLLFLLLVLRVLALHRRGAPLTLSQLSDQEIFFTRVAEGDKQSVEELLQLPHVSPYTLLPSGDLPLHVAIRNGHTELFDLLNRHPREDVCIALKANRHGYDALHIAITQRSSSIINAVARLCPFSRSQQVQRHTYLDFAVEHNVPEAVAPLVYEVRFQITAKNLYGVIHNNLMPMAKAMASLACPSPLSSTKDMDVVLDRLVSLVASGTIESGASYVLTTLVQQCYASIEYDKLMRLVQLYVSSLEETLTPTKYETLIILCDTGTSIDAAFSSSLWEMLLYTMFLHEQPHRRVPANTLVVLIRSVLDRYPPLRQSVGDVVTVLAYLDVVDALEGVRLQHNFAVEHPCPLGRPSSLLHCVLPIASPRFLEKLIASGAPVQKTAIAEACRYDKPYFLLSLLHERGAEIDSRWRGRHALTWAVRDNKRPALHDLDQYVAKKEVILWLLQHGASFNATVMEEAALASIQEAHECLNTATLFQSTQPPPMVMIAAIAQPCSIPVIQFLFRRGGDLNAIQGDHGPPLLAYVTKHRGSWTMSFIERMIEIGCDKTLPNPITGQSVMHVLPQTQSARQ